MVVKIPADNLGKLKAGIQFLFRVKKIKLKDLESVIGLMAFCARAIPSARAFIRRFYDVISSVKHSQPYYYVKVNQEMRSDALVWLNFLDNFNGECYLPATLWRSSDTLELFTDSAGNINLGCAAYLSGHWAQLQYPDHWKDKEFMSDISFLELVPILMALFIWTPPPICKQEAIFKDRQSSIGFDYK